MSKTGLFNFAIDKEQKKVIVEKEFNAPLDVVWAAWTQPEILDQWWAPKPWKAKTKSMNFVPSGQRLYAMLGPEGEEHWALKDFVSITPKTNFRFLDAFCDSEGKTNEEMPRSDWSVDFSESNGSTIVRVDITHERAADLEQLLEMGFKEGFTTALKGLDEILPTLKTPAAS
jgi:uncharacterized protein YndB with AHSA1/START domain